jgi:TonB-linked SusC/RagA family outer membrane protein
MSLVRLRAWITGVAPVLLLIGGATAASAQGSITGRVTDAASGQPVAEARILVIGTNTFAVTNAEGRYTLRNVSAGTAEVRSLRVGFIEQKKTVTVNATQPTTLDFALQVAVVKLSEVVTTATGETRRVELGNSISQVDAAQVVQNSPINNLGELLTARAPGVTVLPSNMTGTGARIRIRGTHSLSLSSNPIYVIDGVRMLGTSSASSIGVGGSQPSRVNDINPDEIENIEIVKGPSAATLYGTDAANGVIVITTKKGRAGQQRWTTFAEGALIQQRNEFPTAYSGWGTTPAGAKTFTCSLTRQLAGGCSLDSLTSLNLFNDSDLTPFGNGRRQAYGAQLSGGTEAVRYFTSAQYEDEIGPMQMPKFAIRQLDSIGRASQLEWLHPNAQRKSSVRLNVNAAPSPTLDLGLQSGFVQVDQRLPQADNNTFGLFSHAYGGRGYKNNDLGSGSLPNMGYRALSPAEIFSAVTTETVNRFMGSVNANWRPTNWLSNRANLGIDYASQVDQNLCKTQECPGSATRILGFANDNRTEFYNYTVDLGSTANFSPKSWLDSKTTVGLQYVNLRTFQNLAGGTELPPGATNLNGAVTKFDSVATSPSRTLGVFVEEAVALRDRLFLTAALRTDKNNAFGTNFQRVYYPKASASYIVSDESFFPKFDWLDQLRLRTAYGASGVQPLANDAVSFYNAVLTNQDRSERVGVVPTSIANPNLKPERATETEGGFEAKLFGSRLNVDLNYYSTTTKDALVSRVLAPSSGAPTRTVRQNIGSVKNAGLEGLINTRLIDRSSFGWDVTLNGSTNANKLVSLGGMPPQIGAVISQIAGYPLNSWFDKTYTFDDANKDGIIQASELKVSDASEYLGYSTPRYEAVLANSVELFDKALRINALIDYKGGYKIENVTEEFRCTSRNNCRSIYDKTAPLAEQARTIALRDLPTAVYSGFIEDGSFIRFRELSLTYSPSTRSLARFVGAQTASVNFAVRNLGFLKKNYSGIDPEMNYGQSNVQNEFQTSPTPTYFTFRLNLGF